MAFGALVTNDAGGVIFNTEEPNYALHSSGSATTTDKTNVWNAIISCPTNGLIFARPSSSSGYIHLAYQGGGYATIGSPFNSSVTFYYRIYVPTNTLTPTESAYGLETYDGSGGLIFSSRLVPLKLGLITSFVRQAGGGYLGQSVTGGYLLMPPFNGSYWNDYGGGGSLDRFAMMAAITDSYVDWYPDIYESTGGSGAVSDPYIGYTFPLIIDTPPT